MDVGLLKAFMEVYRARHFGKAADNLFISQSAVSARIRQLEDELGIRLFTRDRNNIELTAAGNKFLIYAENILNTWNRARQEISVPEGVGTFLSVAALTSIWDIFLENWLLWVHQSNMTTALQTTVMRNDSLIRSVLDGVLDLGFLFDPPKTPQILVKELVPVPLIMVSTRQGIDAEEATADDYIFVDWGTSFSSIHSRQYPDMSPPMLRTTVGRIALGLLKNCGGSAYLPEAMVSEQLGTTLFRVEDAPVVHKDAYAIYSQASTKKETIESVLGWFDKT
ncbi:MAG: LysR family transcriptional regulator [Gammaproteobacteria bacterium]|nr:LysR family transcriptional regulator [Gammaproteobacteria bacterium]